MKIDDEVGWVEGENVHVGTLVAVEGEVAVVQRLDFLLQLPTKRLLTMVAACGEALRRHRLHASNAE